MIIYTWNMQGASNQGESRWTSQIPQLKGGEALLLQECGAPPTDAYLAPVDPKAWIGGRPRTKINLLFGVWRKGTSSRGSDYFFLHADWDETGGRCNLAVLSVREPSGLVFQTNPLDDTKRPMIGMAFVGDCLLTTLHAFSGNGNDGPGFVGWMAAWADAARVPNWFCAGDFNRDPTKWKGKTPVGANMWKSGAETYPSSRAEYDYGFSSKALAAVVPTAMSDPKSDHLPVRFDW